MIAGLHRIAKEISSVRRVQQLSGCVGKDSKRVYNGSAFPDWLVDKAEQPVNVQVVLHDVTGW